jgi:hypothetical protein
MKQRSNNIYKNTPQSELPKLAQGRHRATSNSIPPQAQRKANPLFRGAFEQRAALSLVLSFYCRKESTLAMLR